MEVEKFGNLAKGFTRSPLGIIALFIVLVYGFASMVTGFASSLETEERMPLIWFMVIFPVLVLGVFTWLVGNHHTKLFGPGDYKDEKNFVQMQMDAFISLAAASTQKEPINDKDIISIAESIKNYRPSKYRRINDWQSHILWVDDRPINNLYEKKAFEAIGLRFTLALNTVEALKIFEQAKFLAIISDMGRKEGMKEGIQLLNKVRDIDKEIPFFIYTSTNAEEQKKEVRDNGGNGVTNNPEELFKMISRIYSHQYGR